MSVNKSKIGNKIKYFRMLKKLTQKELGKITRIGEATIRKYELGIRNPKIDKLLDWIKSKISSKLLKSIIIIICIFFLYHKAHQKIHKTSMPLPPQNYF